MVNPNKFEPRRVLTIVRRLLKSKHTTYATMLLQLISLIFKLLTAGASSVFFNFIFNRILAWWTTVPLLFATTSSRVWCALGIMLVGRWFFLLRMRAPGIYATLELGVAGATAYTSAQKLYLTRDSTTALFALLGSVYLAVRAFDNFSKVPALRPKQLAS